MHARISQGTVGVRAAFARRALAVVALWACCWLCVAGRLAVHHAPGAEAVQSGTCASLILKWARYYPFHASQALAAAAAAQGERQCGGDAGVAASFPAASPPLALSVQDRPPTAHAWPTDFAVVQVCVPAHEGGAAHGLRALEEAAACVTAQLPRRFTRRLHGVYPNTRWHAKPTHAAEAATQAAAAAAAAAAVAAGAAVTTPRANETCVAAASLSAHGAAAATAATRLSALHASHAGPHVSASVHESRRAGVLGLHDSAPAPRLAVRTRRASLLQAADDAAAADEALGNTQLPSRLRLANYLELGLTGRGVRVAIFDTGLRAKHPHFRRLMERTDWTGEALLEDVVGHGTFVAGVVASSSPACLGVAPNTELYIARVFDSTQQSYTSWLLDAMNYMLARDVHIASISMGGPDYSDLPFTQKVEEAQRAGILIVSAIGNDGPMLLTLNNPGDMPGVLGVGAATASGAHVAPFSSCGPAQRDTADARALARGGIGVRVKPDVLALGAQLLASAPNGQCTHMSGTSVAAPVVAGVAALLWQSAREAAVSVGGALSKVAFDGRGSGTGNALSAVAADSKRALSLAVLQAITSSASRVHLHGDAAGDAVEASIMCQGAGLLNADAALSALQNITGRTPLLPGAVTAQPASVQLDGAAACFARTRGGGGGGGACYAQCGYWYPYCAQPLWPGAQPVALNLSVSDSLPRAALRTAARFVTSAQEEGGAHAARAPVVRVSRFVTSGTHMALRAATEHTRGKVRASASVPKLAAGWLATANADGEARGTRVLLLQAADAADGRVALDDAFRPLWQAAREVDGEHAAHDASAGGGDDAARLAVRVSTPRAGAVANGAGWLGVALEARLPAGVRAAQDVPQNAAWDAPAHVHPASGMLTVWLRHDLSPRTAAALKLSCADVQLERPAGGGGGGGGGSGANALIPNVHLDEPVLVLTLLRGSGADGADVCRATRYTPLRIPVSALVSQYAPPREARVLFDMAHNMVYPATSYIVRDDWGYLTQQQQVRKARSVLAAPPAGGGSGGGSANSAAAAPGGGSGAAATDLLEWQGGDHLFGSYHRLWRQLRERGYAVELAVRHLNCYDLHAYGVLALVDTEDVFTQGELDAIHAAVRHGGLSLLVFADWYETQSATATGGSGGGGGGGGGVTKQMGGRARVDVSSASGPLLFHDNNLRSYWQPVVPGANIPALNALLAPLGVQLSGAVWSGRIGQTEADAPPARGANTRHGNGAAKDAGSNGGGGGGGSSLWRRRVHSASGARAPLAQTEGGSGSGGSGGGGLQAPVAPPNANESFAFHAGVGIAVVDTAAVASSDPKVSYTRLWAAPLHDAYTRSDAKDGGRTRGGHARAAATLVPVLAMLQPGDASAAGRVAVFTDSACVDDAYRASGDPGCPRLLTAMLDFLRDGDAAASRPSWVHLLGSNTQLPRLQAHALARQRSDTQFLFAPAPAPRVAQTLLEAVAQFLQSPPGEAGAHNPAAAPQARGSSGSGSSSSSRSSRGASRGVPGVVEEPHMHDVDPLFDASLSSASAQNVSQSAAAILRRSSTTTPAPKRWRWLPQALRQVVSRMRAEVQDERTVLHDGHKHNLILPDGQGGHRELVLGGFDRFWSASRMLQLAMHQEADFLELERVLGLRAARDGQESSAPWSAASVLGLCHPLGQDAILVTRT